LPLLRRWRLGLLVALRLGRAERWVQLSVSLHIAFLVAVWSPVHGRPLGV